jgi:hypothetical protein
MTGLQVASLIALLPLRANAMLFFQVLGYLVTLWIDEFFEIISWLVTWQHEGSFTFSGDKRDVRKRCGALMPQTIAA